MDVLIYSFKITLYCDLHLCITANCPHHNGKDCFLWFIWNHLSKFVLTCTYVALTLINVDFLLLSVFYLSSGQNCFILTPVTFITINSVREIPSPTVKSLCPIQGETVISCLISNLTNEDMGRPRRLRCSVNFIHLFAFLLPLFFF